MTWHPLTLTVWLLLALSWLIYLPLAGCVIAVLPRWRPGQGGDADQLRNERRMEAVGFYGRWVLALQVAAAVLLVAGISNVWPAYVPGAMCGTGVLQAMGISGEQSLIYSVSVVGVLYGWRVLQRLDASHPRGMLTARNARLFLLAAPLMVLQGVAWAGAVASAGGSPPVNCCAVVYAQAGGEVSKTIAGSGNGLWWLLICLTGALALAGWGGWQWRRSRTPSRRVIAVVAAGTCGWLWTSLAALKTGVAPHIYQVLSHSCPWCLFLPEHGAVGYLYFGLLTWIAANSMTVAVAGMTAMPASELAAAAARLRCRAGFRLMTGALVFTVAVVWPVVGWWLRFGAWLI
jgi:hypothetical protein